MRSATASKSSTRNGQRPAATTTNGSSGSTSVHAAGSEATSPFSSTKLTLSSSQARRRSTKANSRPHHGWNGCVTRTTPGRAR